MIRTRKWWLLSSLTVLVVLLAGCMRGAASEPPPPTVTPRPSPTLQPTVVEGFVVNVTPVPLHHRHHHRPRPRPTPFVAPYGPYIVLSPPSGPPISRTITVRGANLPPSSPVDLVWAEGGQTSAISTTTQTGRRGGLAARFRVPGSPPGTYVITVEVGGVPYASATYTVTSRATIQVSVSTAHRAVAISVSGRHFLPHLKLLLVAYPVSAGPKPFALGTTHTGRHGRFTFATSTSRLIAGQYMLRAMATNASAAQVAETFFQVVI